ncbi:uncharacterized protein LOC133784987 [Humulus lupulus]|uniref:uncharacterized protein LOC133784987 n=1 Tax=Humulus lupulus TaxID=3486 RepID=UPI002B400E4F|nr:uncharacterized protein LOC133784987 [Humulus lupulus]
MGKDFLAATVLGQFLQLFVGRIKSIVQQVVGAHIINCRKSHLQFGAHCGALAIKRPTKRSRVHLRAMSDVTETPNLSAQLAALTTQMNKELKKMRRLKAENAELLVRMEAMSSQATEFASSRKLEKSAEDLYIIVQRRGEPLQDCVGRFNKEKVYITHCNQDIAISAFRKGLRYDLDLYKELTKYPCKTMEDILAKACAQIKWEEDKANYYHSSPRKDSQRDSRVDKRQSDRRSEPYPYPSRSENRREYTRSSETRLRDGPKIPKYNLSISLTKVIGVLKGLGDKEADKSVIRREVTPPKPPTHEQTVNIITGGSEVSGVTHSAAKRHARRTNWIKGDFSGMENNTINVPAQTINFSATESTRLLNLHHDALVIALYIGNCLTKLILIDNGSSANILFISALREMGIDESKIIKKTTILIIFSGEQKNTLGEIELPVYAEGVILCTRILVVNSPSAYNVILGRPWIHEMEAIPSTYNHVLRFPTKWGVKEIKDQQKDSRACYQTTMKAKPAQL